MREIWARRIAAISGIIVVVLAVMFARSQNPPHVAISDSDTVQPPATDYAGSPACAKCHAQIHRAWSQSGHAFMLTRVEDGQVPQYPFSSVPQPPDGYQWQDILYVVGGYQWKARFVDRRGYLITGSKTQYNLANPLLNKAADWVAYAPDENDKPFNCGTCHTTGYQAEQTMHDLPGIRGNWAEAGIGCESCHGPARQHVANPSVKPPSDRGKPCAHCHARQPMQQVAVHNGFIANHQQHNALQLGKHAALSCNTCHDPHSGVIAARQAKRPAVKRACGACHQTIAKAVQTGRHHRGVACIACHMPRLDKSAWSDEAKYSADMRTHLFHIDTQAVSQTVEENGNTLSIPGITLDFACRHCHRPNGMASELSDERLREFATGIHAQP